MNPLHFAEHHSNNRGFFVSSYELISGYPTISRRVKDLRELEAGSRSTPPSRNPLAYLFAILCFGDGFGGRGSILAAVISIYVFGTFASLAIAAFRAR